MRRAGAAKKARGGAGKGAGKRPVRKPARRTGRTPEPAAKSEAPSKRSGLLGWLQLPLFGAPAPPPLRPSRNRPLPGIRLPRRVSGRVPEAAVQALAVRLATHMPSPLRELVLTDNRSVLLSTTRNPDGGLRLRLHRAFLEANDEALTAVIAFAAGARGKRRQEALSRLRAHVDAWRGVQRRRGAELLPRGELRPRGDVHNLVAIREELNRKLFSGKLAPAITWGRWSHLGRRRRTIRLGSYDETQRLIRIHPALDQPWVPRHFVAAVVHHEMLHALLPARDGGGRRCLHGPEFRRQERELPGYAAAEAWLESNLHRLLRSRPR
jgi:hypothetical protein